MIQRKRGPATQWHTPNRLPELTDEEHAELTPIKHTWGHGDRFYKLAQTHYGSAEHWWIIARYNQLPTEAHVTVGTEILIPMPVGRLLAYWGF